MKVLTLWQPWATLVVIGAKKIETRSFNTNITGDVFIHASKEMTRAQKDLCKTEPFARALRKVDELQLGMIIGIVSIAGTCDTDTIMQCKKSGIPLKEKRRFNVKDWQTEISFGDYSPGRYAWLLKDPRAFTNFTPFVGGVGFTKEFEDRICHVCGCTELNCKACYEKLGHGCYWAGPNLCSACVKKS